MRFDFTGFLYAMSFALDAIEHEFTGATSECRRRSYPPLAEAAVGMKPNKKEAVLYVWVHTHKTASRR